MPPRWLIIEGLRLPGDSTQGDRPGSRWWCAPEWLSASTGQEGLEPGRKRSGAVPELSRPTGERRNPWIVSPSKPTPGNATSQELVLQSHHFPSRPLPPGMESPLEIGGVLKAEVDQRAGRETRGVALRTDDDDPLAVITDLS